CEFCCSQISGSPATLEQVEATSDRGAECSREKVYFQVHRQELLDVCLEVACSLGCCQDCIPQIQPRQSVHPLHTDVFDLVHDRAQDSFSNDKASCCLRISGSEVSSSFSKACWKARSASPDGI